MLALGGCLTAYRFSRLAVLEDWLARAAGLHSVVGFRGGRPRRCANPCFYFPPPLRCRDQSLYKVFQLALAALRHLHGTATEEKLKEQARGLWCWQEF